MLTLVSLVFNIIKTCGGVVVKTLATKSVGTGFESHLTVHRQSRRLLSAFMI